MTGERSATYHLPFFVLPPPISSPEPHAIVSGTHLKAKCTDAHALPIIMVHRFTLQYCHPMHAYPAQCCDRKVSDTTPKPPQSHPPTRPVSHHRYHPQVRTSNCRQRLDRYISEIDQILLDCSHPQDSRQQAEGEACASSGAGDNGRGSDDEGAENGPALPANSCSSISRSVLRVGSGSEEERVAMEQFCEQVRL